MSPISARVLSVKKLDNPRRVMVRVRLAKYRGSFNTLLFGNDKPLIGSCHEGLLDLLYCRDPDLKAGHSFPLWGIR